MGVGWRWSRPAHCPAALRLRLASLCVRVPSRPPSIFFVHKEKELLTFTGFSCRGTFHAFLPRGHSQWYLPCILSSRPQPGALPTPSRPRRVPVAPLESSAKTSSSWSLPRARRPLWHAWRWSRGCGARWAHLRLYGELSPILTGLDPLVAAVQNQSGTPFSPWSECCDLSAADSGASVCWLSRTDVCACRLRPRTSPCRYVAHPFD